MLLPQLIENIINSSSSGPLQRQLLINDKQQLVVTSRLHGTKIIPTAGRHAVLFHAWHAHEFKVMQIPIASLHMFIYVIIIDHNTLAAGQLEGSVYSSVVTTLINA